MELFIKIIIFVLGASLGSFYACIGYRIPNKISTVSPGSFCPKCKNGLKWYMNIPLLSYLFLGGKCAYCKEKISIRYFLIELLTALGFLGSYILFGFTKDFIILIVLISALMITLVTDLEYFYISDRVIIISSLIILLVYMYFNGISYASKSLLSGILMFLMMLLLKIVTSKIYKKETLGDGDIKLSFLIGLTLQVFNTLICLFISSVLAIFVNLLFLKKSKEEIIPFGPFLLMSTIITYLLEFYKLLIIF